MLLFCTWPKCGNPATLIWNGNSVCVNHGPEHADAPGNEELKRFAEMPTLSPSLLDRLWQMRPTKEGG